MAHPPLFCHPLFCHADQTDHRGGPGGVADRGPSPATGGIRA